MIYSDLTKMFGFLIAGGCVILAITFWKSQQIDLNQKPAVAPAAAQ